MSDWSQQDYWDTVEVIAEEAMEQYPDDESGRQEFVTESVDGNEYIIYSGANEVVIEATGNEPDGAEVSEMAGPDADWRKQRMIAAYMAMEADVMEKLQDLHWYEVIVGNIGTVYKGVDEDKARETFEEYVEQSKSGTGRAGGEDVTLMEDDVPEDEYVAEEGEVGA